MVEKNGPKINEIYELGMSKDTLDNYVEYKKACDLLYKMIEDIAHLK